MKKITTISKTRLRVRLVACLYALAYLVIWPAMYGILPSYSSYYHMGGIYFTLATSMLAWALWIHRDQKWSLPAYALAGVALFNCVDYHILHNIFAIIFFLSSTYIMFNDKRYSIYGTLSLYWYIILGFQEGIFWFEVSQVIIISAFHIKYVLEWMKVWSKKE